MAAATKTVPSTTNVLTVEEWEARGKHLFGEDMMNWLFRCSICGTIQSPADFKQWKDRGVTPNNAYQGCIGRLNGIGKRAFGDKLEDGDTCDYTINGLFTISNTMVVHPDGKRQMVFDFADDVCPTCRSPLEHIDDLVRCPNGDQPTDTCARHGYQRELDQSEIERWAVKKKHEIKAKATAEAKGALHEAILGYITVLDGRGAERADYRHTVVDHEGHTIIILKHPQERYLNGIKDVVGEMVNVWDDMDEFVEHLDRFEIDWDEDEWRDYLYIDCPCEHGHGRRRDHVPSCNFCGRDLSDLDDQED